jgi:ABC-2 type transport system permease protein
MADTETARTGDGSAGGAAGAAAGRTAGAAGAAGAGIKARKKGFVHDVLTVATRALRAIPRDTESIIPALIVPVFFYVVNMGAFEQFAERGIPGFDYRAFQLPVAVIFGVTGISRATTLVLDIQDGYFDRLLLSPVHRLALLLGCMAADLALAAGLTLPVLALGFVTGVRFETGFLGLVVFVLLCALWSLVYAGFPYAIALKTGNPAAVNTSFLIFFPFVFLTTAFLPQEALSGWLSTAADYNPLTYILAGLRSLLTVGWDATALFQALLAIAGVGAVSMTLAFRALAGRVKRT